MATATEPNSDIGKQSWTQNGIISPRLAFIPVAIGLGSGDGLSTFQGVYLVGLGWNEGSVGIALSLMGLMMMLVQTFSGDFIDKTRLDRRVFLALAALMTGLSSFAVTLVREGNRDHIAFYMVKVIEGMAASFIIPGLSALTLASYGPHHFDAVMGSNVLWAHIGTSTAAFLTGFGSYICFPSVKAGFFFIGAQAMLVLAFIRFLPTGDRLMGRGFQGQVAMNEQGQIERLCSQEEWKKNNNIDPDDEDSINKDPVAASYWEVLSDKQTFLVCLNGFLFHAANANVIVVLGEMMSDDSDEGVLSKNSMPLAGIAVIIAQMTMAAATYQAEWLTDRGCGRKILFLIGLWSMPIRCALLVWLKDAGNFWLLLTQVLDGIGSGYIGLVHPYLVADITFGTGRFNLIMGLTAAWFGMGITLSNFLGQLIVEKLGHVASLWASFWVSAVPIFIFWYWMPETMGHRGDKLKQNEKDNNVQELSIYNAMKA